ncbi:UDP-N-acetylmuramoyl-tripeptide--D-alanyl-D-alanine ligase [Pedobacter sp. SAFR-022]|uniref:UDP-N-acetylmuramoyl-tripeptide--D-alanyl-D- alanine ligase n=1 Tax=Pedobacter sp. SAFR-022 TaxID=3436861 RepID=UPI003F821E0A
MSNIDSIYTRFLQNPFICTDTRAIQPGCLFFALKGDKFDANTFAASALEAGAAYAIIDNPEYATSDRCILVDDVLTTLQELARYHRSQLTIPVIGLTGSNGKTTTKELINAVLSTKFKTLATKGNLNNHIGVPLTVLAIGTDVEIAIVEMGANHKKEIEFLCSIAQPTHGLITNIGHAHLEGFGGFEGVKIGKSELYKWLAAAKGYTFIYKDNTILMELIQETGLNEVVFYGTDPMNRISGSLEKSDPYLQISWNTAGKQYHTKTNLTGTYNFENILGAICIGDFFGVSALEINQGLMTYQPNNNRSQLTRTASNQVICDFYNANPSSMEAALKNLKALTADKKVAIIADMFEMGEASAEQHRKVAELAESLNLDELILIGKDFYANKEGLKGTFFENTMAAKNHLEQHPVKDSLVLLKGSRGMALEQLLPLL